AMVHGLRFAHEEPNRNLKQRKTTSSCQSWGSLGPARPSTRHMLTLSLGVLHLRTARARSFAVVNARPIRAYATRSRPCSAVARLASPRHSQKTAHVRCLTVRRAAEKEQRSCPRAAP